MKILKITTQRVLCLMLSGSLVGCGTLLYPERRGQTAGKIDVGVAVLDGIGLFFFLVPGLIAFAVDFSTGAIYLPGGARSSLDEGEMKILKFDPKDSTAANIEAILQKETGYSIKLDQADMEVARLKSLDEMSKRFAEAAPSVRTISVALGAI